MTKRTSAALLLGAALIVPALENSAGARSVTASTGKPRWRNEAFCFDFNFTTGGVVSRCGADFIVPLTTDHSGTKTLTVTGRASSHGARCRAVANNRFATSMSASPFLNIPVDSALVEQTTGPVVVPSMGVFFADCIANDGMRLTEFDYDP